MMKAVASVEMRTLRVTCLPPVVTGGNVGRERCAFITCQAPRASPETAPAMGAFSSTRHKTSCWHNTTSV
jgi:hypothetical protein